MNDAAAPSVATARVAADEDGLRLDRWFRRRYPDLTHGRLEKLLRTGQVRVDGKRAKSGFRLAAGQSIRVPPLGATAAPPPREGARPPVASADARMLIERVLYKDDDVIVLDKPAGLAVQGGSGTHRHLDGMLDALRFGAERPRLVHRLDRDTSGVLVLARTARAAAKLTAAFRGRDARKVYWAAVAGVPHPLEGRIDAPLAKTGGSKGERVVVARSARASPRVEDKEGQRAVTRYRVADRAGKRAAWLVLEPETGRTHQLRVHAAALGTPVLGDGKYGGRDAFLRGGGVSPKLHLHARAIRLPHPRGGQIEVAAKLPAHMAATWMFLGFDPASERNPFGDGRVLFPEKNENSPRSRGLDAHA
jgi:23S rRNA pseudouridine955/2504/2580 synthase